MDSFNLSAIALRQQAVIRFLIIILFISGVYSYFHLSKKEEPEYTFRVMIITAAWPGATAHEVELQVLERLEKKLQEVPHLHKLYGYAKPGEAVLYVELEEGSKKRQVADAWYQVRKKVSDIHSEFPPELIGPFFNDEYGDIYGLIYALQGDGYSYDQLKDVADSIRTDFLQIPEIKKVILLGLQPQKIFVEFSHQKIATLGIDPQLILNTIKDQNVLQPAGIIRTPNNEIRIRLTGVFDSLDSIKNSNIHTTHGNFRLGDIATIQRGYEYPPKVKMHFQGKEVIGIAISMESSGNILHLGEKLNSKIEKIQETLPAGIEMKKVINQPTIVRSAINGFMRSFFEAVIIVIALSLFALGMRCGMVVALSIPLVLSITFSVMLLFGVDLQRVSLGALIIAIGLLVDDAMISTEMILRKLQEGYDKFYAATFAYTSTAFPMLTGTLVTIAGFLPIGLAQSDAGEYTFSIFSIVTIALLVSWIVSIIFTPYIGFLLLKAQPTSTHKDIYQTSSYQRIRNIIEWCMIHKKVVVLSTGLVFLLSLWGFTLVQKQFFPPSDRSEVVVDLFMPEGTPYLATEREVNRLEKSLANDPDIVSYTSYIGSSTPRFYLTLHLEENAINYAQIVILTKGGESRTRVVNKLNTLLDTKFPLLKSRKVTTLENGPAVGYPIQFRISGKDIHTLYQISDEISQVMAANPYIININSNWGKITTEKLLIDSDKARQLNLSANNLAIHLKTVLNGLNVTQYREGNELIDIEARGIPSETNQLSTLKDVYVYLQEGRYIPLDQIAYFEPSAEEGVIWRQNGLPTITLRAEVIAGAEALEIANQLDKMLKPIRAQLPSGYFIEVGGVKENSKTAQDSIIEVLPVALIFMLVIMVLQLGNFENVLLVLMTAPLGMIGVTLALLVSRLPFGFVAMLGVVSLSGMIMRNSVILIDQIESNLADHIDPWDSVVKATVERFRPIALTASAAIFAMIPLAYNVFWAPMAISIIGGLLAATVLTIIFLPALFVLWHGITKNG